VIYCWGEYNYPMIFVKNNLNFNIIYLEVFINQNIDDYFINSQQISEAFHDPQLLENKLRVSID
jgi:hypothetical protein